MTAPVFLVTGAAGQLGRAMLRLLRARGIQRRCVDVLPPPEPPQEPWHRCDLSDPSCTGPLGEFAKDATHAVHLASRVTNAKDLAADFPPQFRLEVVGSLNLLRALGPSLRHLAYASSMTVYGVPKRLPVREDQAPSPHCVYALCKLAVERHLAVFKRERKIAAAALRIASVYGPGPSRGRAIPTLIERALKGQPLDVFGDGTVRRDYIYVDDVCEALLSAALQGVDETVNVGTGLGTTTLELASLIAELAGSPQPPRLVPRALDEQSAASMVLDVRRLASSVRFSPRVTLREGLRRTIEHFRAAKGVAT